ncbi:MAG: hypothetical protein HYV42_01710 [Candidatus Magasanikbacteria bacterium]|nr:hypothetical protein [Candidatus Magasanikbacteria bacterium]
MRPTIIILSAIFALALLTAATAQAQLASEEIGKQLEAAAGPSGAALGEPIDPRVTVVFIIRVLLSLTATVLVALNLYAGFMWMTAAGNEERVTSAKTIIRNATIGLIIVLSAYSITIFAFNLARGTPPVPPGAEIVIPLFGK